MKERKKSTRRSGGKLRELQKHMRKEDVKIREK